MKHKAFFLTMVALFGLIIILPAQSVSVMTFNIRLDVPSDGVNAWDNRKADMVNLLKHYNPDFVGMQEVLPNQLHYLDSELKHYAWVGVGRDDGKEKGEYMAVFYDSTKLTVKKWSTFWLSDTPDKVSMGWDAACHRTCTYILFKDKKSGKEFWAFNTHFDHKGETARLNSAKLIVKKVDEINTKKLPVVFLGDLNTEPKTEPIKILKEHFHDAAKKTKKDFYGPKGTFNGFQTTGAITDKIDYIFEDGFKVKSCEHIDDRTQNNLCISDHYPVMAKLAF